ncbi:MAG: C1 family peptidase [Bacteroidia bacterium]|nr:C1 family peptidase [Bacteroidia bacterium]
MRNSLRSLVAMAMVASTALGANAQEEKKAEEGYTFTHTIDIPTTSVKDQFRSGTCWSFSTVSFLESEMMRLGKDSIDLSDMYAVAVCYRGKGERAVRLHTSCEFGAGGAAHDLLWVLKNYGMVPEEAYKGLNYGLSQHNHGELDRVAKGFINSLAGDPNTKSLTTAWKKAYAGILDAYLGELPTEFTFNGKTYTPRTFADQVVGLNPDDYVCLSSYTHHPFYGKFILEVPDNWLCGEVYNVPLEDLMRITDNALKNGYSIAWGSDVSEKGFSYYNGVAVVPETNEDNLEGTELSRWQKLSKGDRQSYGLKSPVKEKTITQEMRQEAFDNYETTDDHGMHIVGMAKDQNGTEYYVVKNSWNVGNPYKGYLYVSKAFYAYKTMDIMIHKNAIPSDLKKKLGIK